MQPTDSELSCDDAESLLSPAPVATRKRSALAGTCGALVVMAVGACAFIGLPHGQQRSEGMPVVSLISKSTLEADKQMILKKIKGFAHICKECRGDAEKYYKSKLDEVDDLGKKCDADDSTCDEQLGKVMDEVNGAWAGTDCPEEMPMSCSITSECKPFPTKACAPKTCHPINLLKSFAKNNGCTQATMECDGEEKVSLKDVLTSKETVEADKQMLLNRIKGFAHICKECRGDAEKYYKSKLDEVDALGKKCDADETACDDANEQLAKVVDEVNGAWAGTDCPAEMPMSCSITSECKPFPKKACAPKTCHPINLLKSFAKNNKCTEATMECDGEEKVSLSDD